MVSTWCWITALCMAPEPCNAMYEIVKSIPLRTLNGPLSKPASKSMPH